jgi:hypothetical protein
MSAFLSRGSRMRSSSFRRSPTIHVRALSLGSTAIDGSDLWQAIEFIALRELLGAALLSVSLQILSATAPY